MYFIIIIIIIIITIIIIEHEFNVVRRVVHCSAKINVLNRLNPD